MALRRTRKNNSYNKDNLANKLDTLASNVAKKGVFVVIKSDPGYKVFNIINKKVLLDNIPYLSLAKELTDKVNKTKEPMSFENLNRQIDRYYKHLNDILFYKNTIKNTNDFGKLTSAESRLQESIYAFKDAKEKLILL